MRIWNQYLNIDLLIDCFFLWPAKQCSIGLEYRECISCCPASCNLERTCIDSKLACLDGCYCPDGDSFQIKLSVSSLVPLTPFHNHFCFFSPPHKFTSNLSWTERNSGAITSFGLHVSAVLSSGLIYKDGGCVTHSDCPCEYHGMFYPPGQTLQEECNNWWATDRENLLH